LDVFVLDIAAFGQSFSHSGLLTLVLLHEVCSTREVRAFTSLFWKTNPLGVLTGSLKLRAMAFEVGYQSKKKTQNRQAATLWVDMEENVKGLCT
jgi:hypothetical protein